MAGLNRIFAHLVLGTPDDQVTFAAHKGAGVDDRAGIVAGAGKYIFYGLQQLAGRQCDNRAVAFGQFNR